MESIDSFILNNVMSYCDITTLYQVVRVNKWWYNCLTQTKINEHCTIKQFLKLSPQEKLEEASRSGLLVILERFYEKRVLVSWYKSVRLMTFTGQDNLWPFIQKICDNDRSLYKYALQGACKGGHLDLTIKLFDKIAESEDLHSIIETGISFACRGGCVSTFEYMWNKHNSHQCSMSFCEIFKCACRGGNMTIIQEVIKQNQIKKPPYMLELNWIIGLRSACIGGHIPVVELICTQSTMKITASDWFECQNSARQKNQEQMVEFIKNKL